MLFHFGHPCETSNVLDSKNDTQVADSPKLSCKWCTRLLCPTGFTSRMRHSCLACLKLCVQAWHHHFYGTTAARRTWITIGKCWANLLVEHHHKLKERKWKKSTWPHVEPNPAGSPKTHCWWMLVISPLSWQLWDGWFSVWHGIPPKNNREMSQVSSGNMATV